MALDDDARREFAERLSMQSAQMMMMAGMSDDPGMRADLLLIARDMARQARDFGLIADLAEV